MPKYEITVTKKGDPVQELPPVLKYHRLHLMEFVNAVITRTAEVVSSNPDVPLELIEAIVLDGVREELKLTPNIEVVIDVFR